MRSRVRLFPVLLSVLSLGLVSVSLAWACSPQGYGYDGPPAATNNPPPSPAASPAPQAAPQPAPQAAPQPAPQAAPQAAPQPAPNRSPGSQPAPQRQRAPAGQRQGARVGQGSPGGPTSSVGSPTGTTAFADSLPAAAPGDTRSAAHKRSTRSAGRNAGGVSERSATSDLAAAYASPRGAGLPAAASGGAEGATAHASQFTLGLAFLGFGLVALFGGLLIAAARKRRQPVRSERASRPSAD